MDHYFAQKIFTEIQARPYGLALYPNQPCNNCFCKSKELAQRLAMLGYTIRVRIAETQWDKDVIPAEILDLLPPDLLITHFVPEIYMNDEWRFLDPSFQPALSRHGFTIGSWDNGESCFKINKLYSQQEAILYQKNWFPTNKQEELLRRGRPCWRAMNQWFATLSQQ